jgi:hypothetical protein
MTGRKIYHKDSKNTKEEEDEEGENEKLVQRTRRLMPSLSKGTLKFINRPSRFLANFR